MAEPGFTPFFDTLMKQNLIEKNIFAFYMSMNPLKDDSELTFGSYNVDRFEGELSWHPVRDKLFWALQLDDVRLGDRSLGLCGDEGKECLVTPDSGTSLSTMPSWALEKFHSNFDPIKVECDEGDDFLQEDLVFVIDGVDYAVPSHHWYNRSIDESLESGGHCQPVI